MKPLVCHTTTPQAPGPSRVLDEPLPDIQRQPAYLEPCHRVPVTAAGLEGLPATLRVRSAQGEVLSLEASVSAFAPLTSAVRGLDMSRIPRSLEHFSHQIWDSQHYEAFMQACGTWLGVEALQLGLSFRYPLRQPSLISPFAAPKYYPLVWRARWQATGAVTFGWQLDFEYASSCPCSLALVRHSEQHLGLSGVAHSQRSLAQVCVTLAPGAYLLPEALIEHCQQALKTETQSIVLRPDEQAFAQLNAQHPKFVEDAVRLLYARLIQDPRLQAFQVTCTHYESLHSHNVKAQVCHPAGADAQWYAL